MSFHLDPQTIYFSLMCGHVLTIILLSAYHRSESRDTSISIFFTAKLLQAGAWLMMFLNNGLDGTGILLLANTLLFLGTAFESGALLRLQGVLTPKYRRIGMIITGTAIVTFSGIVFFYNHEALRITVASFFSALLIAPPALRFLLQRQAPVLSRLMGILYTALTTALLVRAIAAQFPAGSVSFLAAGVSYNLFSLSSYMTMILANTGFVLLAKQRSDEELMRLASYDDLTQIWNRRTFLNKAGVVLDRYAKRHLPVSFLLFDIDGFKGINDTYGHDIGDRVLREMSDTVSRQLGIDDLFGRYGGDEFAILLPGTPLAESTLLAERIRVAVEGTYTLSVGALTFLPEHRSDLDRIYKCCDLALYEAKRGGRNQVRRAETHFEAPLIRELEHARV